MAVHLTRIYTKTGDGGSTALGDMSRVRKADRRVGAYADCDETNAAIGTAIALGGLADPLRDILRAVQNDLFDVGADLSTPLSEQESHLLADDTSLRDEAPPGAAEPVTPQRLRVSERYVERLERWCDEYNERLPKLTSFVLPGGTPGAALLHQARTVCRRAERSAWLLREEAPKGVNPAVLRYLNRLSDLLFILARIANPEGDVLWRPGAHG